METDGHTDWHRVSSEWLICQWHHADDVKVLYFSVIQTDTETNRQSYKVTENI